MFKRLITSLVCLTFSFSNLQYVHAQPVPQQARDFSVDQLPIPGTMLGQSAPFSPLALKGLIVNPQKPLEFQFIVDTGRGPQDTASVKDQANQLVKYFLAGLTIPEGDLWVNLSPYEKNRIVPQALGQTDLGRDLLAQDYILKQLTASLIYPEKDLGKEFWNRVYAKAQEQFGTTNVPVNTFNKVWILPNQAQVFENANAAYVTQSTLKVMLDEDYTALQKHAVLMPDTHSYSSLRGGEADAAISKRTTNDTHTVASQVVRQIILPEIEKEVNTGKNFAPLRQIYQALILAKWYKETIQNGLLDAVYTNKKKVAGVNVGDPAIKEKIYQRYLKAYKKGAFNYIKEDPTPDGQMVPRKYFSGGTEMRILHLGRTHDGAMFSALKSWALGALLLLTVSLGSAANPASAQGTPPQVSPAETQPAPTSTDKEKEFQASLSNLQAQDFDVKRKAIFDLGDSGDTRAIGPLLGMLKDADYFDAEAALSKLGASEGQLMDGYLAALSSFNCDEAESKLATLGASKEQMVRLIAALLSTNEYAQQKAADRLGDLGDTSAIKPLLKLLATPTANEDIRSSAKGALVKLGASQDQITLAEAMARKTSAALEASKKQALQHQIDALSSNDKKFPLPQANESEVPKDVYYWIDILTVSPDPKKRAIAGDELVKMGISAVKALITQLNFDDGQGEIESVLVRIGKPAVPGLIEALGRNEEWKVPQKLESVLIRMGRPAVPELIAALGEKETSVDHDTTLKRGNIIVVLGKIGGTKAIAALLKALRDPDNLVRTNAAEALKKLGVKLPLKKSNLAPKPVTKKALVPEKGKSHEDNQMWDNKYAIGAGSLVIVLIGILAFIILDPKKVEERRRARASREAKEPRDSAMLPPDMAALTKNPDDPGGIDLNQIKVKRTGKIINVQFDQAQLNELMQGGFKGFTPEITGMIPISSPLPYLGLGPVSEVERLAKV